MPLPIGCLLTALGYTVTMPGLIQTVREAAAKSGLSQADIMRASGIDRGRVSRFMRGERDLSVEALEAVARAVGLVLVAKKTGRNAAGKAA